MGRRQDLSWGDLVTLCRLHGRDKVLSILQAQVNALESLQVHLWGGDYEEQHRASGMSGSLLKRTETLIRLRQMDQAEMDRLWATATPRQQRALLKKWGRSEADQAGVAS